MVCWTQSWTFPLVKPSVSGKYLRLSAMVYWWVLLSSHLRYLCPQKSYHTLHRHCMQHRIYLSLWEKCQGKMQIANDCRYFGNAYSSYSCEIFTLRLYDFVAVAGFLHGYAVCGVRWFGLYTFRFNDWTNAPRIHEAKFVVTWKPRVIRWFVTRGYQRMRMWNQKWHLLRRRWVPQIFR